MTEELLEVSLLDNPENFLKIKETLTRMGVSSKENTLYQSCHILHKKGKYYIVHFKELFKLDGKNSSITDEDVTRRNTIASLIEQWGLCKVLKKIEKIEPKLVKVLSHQDKSKWTLVPKYTVGIKKES